MAIKSKRATLPKSFLAEALLAKSTPLYASEKGYKGFDYEAEIYPQARWAFPDYNRRYNTNEEFTKYFARDLNRKEPQLVKQLQPAQEAVADGQTNTQEVSSEQPVPLETGGEPAGGPGGIGLPPMPTASISSGAGRVIHEVFHAPEPPKPDTALAGNSGAATEAGDASKLVSTGKGGNVVEAGKPSELVTAHSSGAIKEAPPKQIFIANKNNVVTGIQNIKSPSWFKTFGSNAQIFAKRNLGRIADGLTHAVLPSGANFLGKTGLKAFNHGGNFLSNLSNIRSKASASAKSLSSSKSLSTKKWALAAGGAFFLFFFMSAFGGITGDTSTSEAAPISTTTPSYQPGEGKGIISCPFNATSNPRITNGSRAKGGHCSESYEQDYGVCAQRGNSAYTGKETAIDVVSDDRLVYFPQLNNTDVEWTNIQVDQNTNYIIGGETVSGGYSIKASAQSNGKNYEIRFVHMNEPQLNQSAKSGDLIGTYRSPENHVHITIKENGSYQNADEHFELCTK